MAELCRVLLRLFSSRCVLATNCQPTYSYRRCYFGMADCRPCSISGNSWCWNAVFCRKKPVFEYLTAPGGPFLAKLEDGFSQNAFFYLLALRLVPTAPFWVVNIVPALTRMGIVQFLAATFIGIIPGSFVYVWVGRSFDQALTAGQKPDFSILSNSNILLPLGALGLLSLLPVFVRRSQTRIKNSRKNG